MRYLIVIALMNFALVVFFENAISQVPDVYINSPDEIDLLIDNAPNPTSESEEPIKSALMVEKPLESPADTQFSSDSYWQNLSVWMDTAADFEPAIVPDFEEINEGSANG